MSLTLNSIIRKKVYVLENAHVKITIVYRKEYIMAIYLILCIAFLENLMKP